MHPLGMARVLEAQHVAAALAVLPVGKLMTASCIDILMITVASVVMVVYSIDSCYVQQLVQTCDWQCQSLQAKIFITAVKTDIVQAMWPS